MQIDGRDIAMCSWSLHATDPHELIDSLNRLGLSHVHLAVAPLLHLTPPKLETYKDILRNAGITITATMIGFPTEDYSSIDRIRLTGGFAPDREWEQRRATITAAGEISRQLDVNRLSMHIGFVPRMADQPGRYTTFVRRCREVADGLSNHGVQLLLETGQEPADVLVKFIEHVDRSNLSVNFDPANMILYGAGDPIDAIRAIGSRIAHVHIKDATPANRPRVDWGSQTPIGKGAVPWRQFFVALDDIGYRGPLAIEREAGDERFNDIAKAIDVLQANGQSTTTKSF